MAPIFTALQRGELERALVRRLGLMVMGGFPTDLADSGTTTTLVDSRMVDASDARAVDQWLGKFKGTGAGEYDRITTVTPGSDQFTWAPASTAPDTTTEWGVVSSEIGDPHMLQFWLREAHQRLNFNKGRMSGLMEEVVGREVVMGNAFINGAFGLYSTANVADSWTVDGNTTFTEETTIVGAGPSAYKGVTDGSNPGYVRQLIKGEGRFHKQSRPVKAKIYCVTDARLTVELTDGVTTKTKTHGGTGWEWFDLDSLSFAANMTKIQGSIEISAGGAVTFYIAYFFMEDAPRTRHLQEIDADRNLVAIEGHLKVSGPISESQDHGDDFDEPIWPGRWDIVYDSTRKMKFEVDAGVNGRLLRYEGYKNHTALTAVTTTWPEQDYTILDVAEAIARRDMGGEYIDGDSRDPIKRGDVAAAVAQVLASDGKELQNVKLVESR